MEHANPLGEEKISVLIRKFSIPAIIGMIVNALYNVVDRIFIGNSPDIGGNGIGGITIAFPIMIILLAIGILYGIGGSTLFSMKLGNNEPEEAEHTLGNALFLLILSGIVFTILGQIFLKPLLILFGATNDILPYAMEYMRIILFGSTFQIIGMGLNNFMRADGNPKLAMLTMFLGAGSNIVLDPIFIFVFHMGMAGAAYATILSQLVSTIWVIQYFLGKHSKNKLRLHYLKPNLSITKRIVSLGLPGFFLQLANSALNIVLNKNLQNYGGVIAINSMGIINSLQTLLLMPIIGLNQGIQPIISFNYGAKKYDRVKKTSYLAIIIATIIVIIGYIITRVFPNLLISLFNRDPELIEFGSFALKAWFLCLPVIGFQIIASNFFQAIGKSGSAMFLTLTRQVILLIPALLILPLFLGLNGILYAAPFADFFSFLLTGIWYYREMKKWGKNL